MKRYEINTPVGTRDRIYDECKVRRRLENALISVFEESGFSEVSSPTMEYMDVVMTPLNPLPQEILYKISECTGRMLVLRPDMTTPIARIAATKIDTSALPAKFYYMDKVFRASREDTGRPTEIMQGGVERIGNGGIEADVDTILLAAKALRACTDKKFHIEIGHAGYFKSLAQKLDISDAEFERMRGYIENKNFAALSDMLLEYGDTEATRAINKLSRM
ncbi:MAG: ATP phosphoribosyltransferase regulatory subunit, partial [Clostridia bacterium]